MKIDALKRFRSGLADNEPVYGQWVTQESASITEMVVALVMDWEVIDAEHGHLSGCPGRIVECATGVRARTELALCASSHP